MKYIALFFILFAVMALTANPEYYPLTTIAEALVIDDNPSCDNALQYLDTILGETNSGEFLAARLYSNSGDLSNSSVDARLDHHNASLFPSVVFNGSMTFAGPTPLESYRAWVDQQSFNPSPLQMEINSFNSSTGEISLAVTVVDPDLTPDSYQLVWFLVENNVGNATNVTRQVLNQPITIPAVGVQTNFNNTFTIAPTWNESNLWAAVSLERNGTHILQSSSTLDLPQYYLRCSFPWDNTDLVADETMATFNSDLLWFFNLGAADNMSMRLVVDSTDVAADPLDWYFNYCDEVGNCYPGGTPLPLVMGSGDALAFHLNLWIGSTGIAYFHYEITSPDLGTFTVPFTVRTSDYVHNADEVFTPAPARLQANYPNPFRGSTSFLVNAKSSATASIQIYNSRGQKVDETYPEPLQQGENRIAWQARQDLPAGVYFYRLKDEPGSLRRMLLLK